MSTITKSRNGYRAVTPTYGVGDALQAIARAEIDGSRLPDHDRILATVGLNTAAPLGDGYVASDGTNHTLMTNIHDAGVLLRHSRRIPMPAGTFTTKLPIPDMEDLSSGRLTSIVVSRVPDGVSIPTSKLNLRKAELDPSRLSVLLPVTDELVGDVTLLGDYVLGAVRDEMAFRLDREIISGIGSDESLGILAADCTITVSKGAQGADTITAENLKAMAGRMLPRSFANARWYCHTTTLPELMGTESFTAPDAGAPAGRLFTRPIELTEHCPILGERGDIIFADLAQYLVVEQELCSAFSEHFSFVENESAFRFIARVEGQPKFSGPITPVNGSETVSPFVVLAERAE